jgi:DNA-binding MarR family transcriptional regulator
MRRDPHARELYARLGALAGVDLPPGSIWALCRIAREGSVPGTELAQRAGVAPEEGRPYVDRLVADGLVERSDGVLRVTEAGRRIAERMVDARCDALRDLLDGWDPDEHPDLTALLRGLARDSLGNQPDQITASGDAVRH